MKHINAWTTYSKKEFNNCMSFSEDYRQFISKYKTCREFSEGSVKLAKSLGFKFLDDYIESHKELKAGDKIFTRIHGRFTILAVIGKKPMQQYGLNILGAHIDSPRIDIKQNPIYQKDGVVMLETHYYGGISLYQWVGIPMSLHGIVCKTDGTKIIINIGENPNDPVFFIDDLLVHLSHKDQTKKVLDYVNPEKLDLLFGGRPLIKTDNEKCSAVDTSKTAKANSCVSEPGNNACTQMVLKILKEQYDIDEEDFQSAELEAIPIGECRDCGIDRSMLMGYGHDDSAAAYPSLRALLRTNAPEKTCMCVLTDKEEVGSLGATGMECRFFENTIAEMLELCGVSGMLSVRRALQKSSMLSSDVSAAVDPNYHDKFELNNSCYFGDGLVFNKYGGSDGKKNSNDARPEFFAKIRKICRDNNIVYQTSELGAVGVGGGGTIAAIPAHYGMDVIDAGVPVLSMHCPWEVVNKADIYEAYKGYCAFLKNC